MRDDLFIVQSYHSKAERLVAQPAKVFADATTARRAGGRLARFRAGVVVMSQKIDPVTGSKERPNAIAVYGRVPDAWRTAGKAA